METTIEKVYDTVYRNRRIIVLRVAMPFVGVYCNGYISTTSKNKGESYVSFSRRIKTDELTFSGYLDEYADDSTWFFGFDSAHLWNDHNPESKTADSVLDRAKSIADEMVKQRI